MPESPDGNTSRRHPESHSKEAQSAADWAARHLTASSTVLSIEQERFAEALGHVLAETWRRELASGDENRRETGGY